MTRKSSKTTRTPTRRISRVPAAPRRSKDAHKGNFGRILVIGGSAEMMGAPTLSGMSALRCGAGLVTLAVPICIQPHVATLCPCATTRRLPETKQGRIDAERTLIELKRSNLELEPFPDVVAIGPGLGPSPAPNGRALWKLIDHIRLEMPGPVACVIDADALDRAPREADGTSASWDNRAHPDTVITPHPGELARMLDVSPGEIQSDREGYAYQTAEAMNRKTPQDRPAVVVLKGAGTIVTDGKRKYVNRTGNPGMATGGSGDVLTGMIAALIGQGMAPFDAAVLGVHLHGLTGDLAADEIGQHSLIATDLIEYLPAAFIEHQQRK